MTVRAAYHAAVAGSCRAKGRAGGYVQGHRQPKVHAMTRTIVAALAIAAAADLVVTSPIAASCEFSHVRSSGAASLINMLAGLVINDF